MNVIDDSYDNCDKIIIEGKAEVIFQSDVFYNPVQEFNRDLTILVISHFSKEHNDSSSNNQTILQKKVKHEMGIRILEALAATGLRSIRFALEVPGVQEIVANDFSTAAIEYITKNTKFNNVSHLITPSFSDATILMHQTKYSNNKFHCIDLDPYGSPTPFLDAVVQSIDNGGLLCVTCTDMAVLCGNAPETCHSKYGSVSLKSKFCHEMALRILLRSIESRANCYSRYIVPLLSISVDFYCRVFVKVFTSQLKVKQSASKLSMVYCCNTCCAYYLQPLCTKLFTNGREKIVPTASIGFAEHCIHCNGRHYVGGPIWSDPIHDVNFVRKLLKDLEERKTDFRTSSRIQGILTVVTEELQDQPLYYDSDYLCSVIHCTAIGFLPIRSALLNGGYQVSLSHADKKSLKTNAPMNVIWDIIRCWVRKFPVHEDRLREGSASKFILSKTVIFEADFTTHPLANPESRKKGLVRWQLNPEKDWGPKPKAGRQKKVIDSESKAPKKNKLNILEMTKRYQCKRFNMGQCDLGDNCVYNHSDVTESHQP